MNRKAFFRKKQAEYKINPVLFFKEVLRFEPDEWQAKVAMDIVKNARVTVRSGQGVGKTGLEAALLFWFLTCHPYARVVATAPSKRQLHDVLWSEVAKWQAKSPLLEQILKWTKSYVYVLGMEKRWFATARTAQRPENIQGFHEENMLFLVDEASGVRDDVLEAILGTLSGSNNKLLLCGNPNRAFGVFYNSHTKNRDNYKVHHISSRDSARTNKDNIKALEDDYGPESNVVRVRVDGEFPLAEDDVFIPISLVEAAIVNEFEDDHAIGKISIGVDIARFGADETVIVKNVGGDIKISKRIFGQDLMATVGNIVNEYKLLIKNYPEYKRKIYIYIDDTGLGGGVTDRLKEVRTEQKLWRMEVRPVNAAERVPDKEASAFYANITTWLWAILRDCLKNKEIILPDDNSLAAQLSVRKFRVASNGKTILESKDDMKARGIRSPDIADAVTLSCFVENISTSGPPADQSLSKDSYWRP